ncbi:MAG TPA: hypothetical protein DCM73_12420 [Clostridiales bacterium]|nr:hypothetical protein [Clostridiales bacterium]
MRQEHQVNIKLDNSVLEEIRHKVLYPFNSMKEVLLYAVVANIFIVIALIIIGCLSAKIFWL